MSVLALSRHGRALSDISKATKPNVVSTFEEQRSLLSRFFVLWISPLLLKGCRTSLVYEDLPPLKQKHRSAELLRNFKPSPKSTLLFNIIWHFKGTLSVAMICKVIAMALDYVNPLLLSLLIDDRVLPRVPPLTRGLSISVMMLIVSELKSIFLSGHMYLINRDGCMCMSILSNSMIKKSLRLSMESRNNWPSSRISNLVTVDLEIISMAMQSFHFAWSAVVEVSIALVIIYNTIGHPGLGAIIVMLVYVPVNIVVSKAIRYLQVKQMEWKDRRVNFTKEAIISVISGLKVVKVFAWERAFEEEIDRLRAIELTLLKRAVLILRTLQALNASAPFLTAMVCFAWFVLTMPPGAFTPQVAFVSLVVFNMLRRPMTTIAPSIQNLAKGLVSFNRIDKFLKCAEIQHIKHKDDATEPQPVHIALRNAYFSWKTEKEDLKEITVELNQGDFKAIVGPVGSGKSSVLSAIIGDLYQLDGVRSVYGTMGYVPQIPWIMNHSVKANILYGKEYDKNLYERVTRACDLRRDFYAMPRYDSTMVGDNGMALSGGQRARIALARAIYQDCDIYLLDDPFSALDPHVKKTVSDQVLGPKGLLAKKTVLLVTHDTSVAKHMDQIYVINDGKIEDTGTYDELCESNELFSAMRRESEKDEDKENIAPPPQQKKKKAKAVMFEPPDLPEESKGDAVKQGRFRPSVYMTYLQAFSYHWAITFTLLLVGRYALQGYAGIWLSNWSDHNTQQKATDSSRTYYLHIYILLGVATVIVSTLTYVFATFGGIRASAKLHTPMVAALLRCRMVFLETTPLGRILNRFTGDLDTIDNALPLNMRLTVDSLMQMVMVMAIVSINIPFFLVCVIPFSIIYTFLLRRFVGPTRQIRRIESAKRSALLSSIAETVTGASSIRSFGRVKVTCLQLQQDVDAFTRCRYLSPATQRWLSLRMELLGNIMIFCCATMVTVFHHKGWITVGEMGLCVSYALTLTETMNFSVRMLVLTESNVVAVERVKEYHEILPEGEWTSEYPLVDAWPHSGSIDVRKLDIRYPVGGGTHAIQEVTFNVKGGERIGICGRTAAGKSTLVSALLRLVGISGGDIKIDGVNTAEIGLHELRGRITFIPQEPVLFSSSLRFNLDPLNQCADSDIWLALEACQLKELVRKSKHGLHWQLEEGGINLSVGERQLVCLCRALLKGGQVVILDEATASVDRPTERILQEVIADFFKHSTVVLIAHRLETVINCDRILVLEDGRVVDYDTPKALMEKEDSLFRELVQVE